MIWLQLFWEFFKTGLFALGGGLSTIPFLYDMIDTFHWFTSQTLVDMIAISESTPGPMGVNMATYVGYTTTHTILGGVIATLGLVTPSIIIICIIAQFLKKFKESHWVEDTFYGLRPAIVGLITCVGIGIFITAMFKEETISISHFEFFHFVLFLFLFLFSKKFKSIHPIFIICLSAYLGILFQL